MAKKKIVGTAKADKLTVNGSLESDFLFLFSIVNES